MVISETIRSQIEVEIAKYPRRRGALLPALHLVQKELGWIAPETARELATIFGIEAVDVMEVVTFYNMFYDAPQGRHHVHVCTNLPCSLRGARDLLRGLESHLWRRGQPRRPTGASASDTRNVSAPVATRR
jgi:NADH-quinone oxidoreductase subunit E